MELLNGSVYVFKRSAIYKLVRTGDVTVPYRPVTISKVVGAISRKGIVPGEDESGSPCLYFLAERGPYRLGSAGLQYLGGDIETLWATVNVRPSFALAHGVYDTRKGQVRWWVPIGAELFPTQQIVFHVRLGRPSQAGRVVGGWTTTAANSTPQSVTASAMLPSSLTNRDTTLVPVAIQKNAAGGNPPVLWTYTSGAASDDTVHATTGAVTGTTTFAPTFTTKTFSLGMGDLSGVKDVYVACTPSAGGTVLSATLSRNFGEETRTKTRTYTGALTRVPQQITDLTMAAAQYASVSLTTTTQQPLVVDEIVLRVTREEPL
jgi:hypothetical protein